MKALLLAALALLPASAAYPQTASIRSEPLPPLQRQWQQEGSPPVQQAPIQQTPFGSATTTQGEPRPSATTQRPNTWLPASVVKLQALDKVNAQATALTIKVGGSATFGSLTIVAKACVVRPTDQPADAAAFLAITDSHPDSPGFNGWMLEDEPSVSMMEHPIYDLRVTGCT